MRWKWVAWAGCLLPVLAGCGSVRHLAADLRPGPGDGLDGRTRARGAWHAVCAHHPRRAFTDEFRDGFLDGYCDCLDRHGAAPAPPGRPFRFLRSAKYATPEGRCLVRDYYLGFRYGGEAAGGRSAFPPDGPCAGEAPARPLPPVVPMKPPTSDSTPIPPPRPVPGGTKPPRKSDDPPISVPPEGRSPLPKPELPVIKPFNPDLSGGKFTPVPVLPDPDRLPVPDPPLPVPGVRIEPLPIPAADEPKSTIPPILGPLPVSVPVLKFVLPTLPDAALTPPASDRMPAILSDLPVIPFRHPNPLPIPKK